MSGRVLFHLKVLVSNQNVKPQQYVVAGYMQNNLRLWIHFNQFSRSLAIQRDLPSELNVPLKSWKHCCYLALLLHFTFSILVSTSLRDTRTPLCNMRTDVQRQQIRQLVGLPVCKMKILLTLSLIHIYMPIHFFHYCLLTDFKGSLLMKSHLCPVHQQLI